MDKVELRFKGKNILQNISAQDREKMEAKMLDHLFESDLWRKARVVGITLSQSHEWSTETIIQEGWNEGKKMAVPKCFPENKQMRFYHFFDYDQLERVYFGLREPKPDQSSLVEKNTIDLLLVPGLLYDDRGYRIGYGGGYYDRFIEGFQGRTLMIASDQQKCSSIPYEEFDQRVEYILTETGVHPTYKW
ncbi:5-formyltetrahydrofolate cyclo-ligase [Halobacillus karajensis]|uniref:5-formyltetrahydrofolate cyclo-ligase n=1 Tax=Halobacillus karajensis TaxID=195088 RepID=A0A024P643_9BACI|nr:5-formyltetrahydrofolate cyclo-ligase [Halobacillus karajensis]CDQ18001.1 5-formyltetrahydrofolate cyclo-ligase family protein [Halobacillus karajensis]CDQ24350.1 5-formyltetrahydrofolate cyclo-ligase family protein [Halobacillus karajensis]CDQ29401.1 5-formyltetrahydrofolate cyclo-ligase family protein [Halobacillus karajensis]SEH61188.1 5-formyltetrahydrofolate cyclo-ligase [Halobacillus karajensis]